MQNGQHSAYLNTQKAWNEAKKATRQAMLKAAGQNVNDHYARVFAFLPQYVRSELIYQNTRKAAAIAFSNKSQTNYTTTNPPGGFWWTKD
jgi:hypothetical protein